VAEVRSATPAARAGLQPGDTIVGVDGRRIRSVGALRRAMRAHSPGDTVRVSVRRRASTTERRVKTIADPQKPSRAIFGIAVEDAVDVKLPIKVRIDTRGVGGPSAGLAFALDLMEEFGRDIDRGHKVAATGALALDGSVGEIGAVKQKTFGAREAGVDVFVVPAGSNAREARRYAHGLRVIAVKSFQQALRALATLPKKH
jgi:PDZ domain-containing protein